ncbi:MAG TPA: hypothetical protein VF041_08420 [Gemmatimonadaceae bacterium]
MARSSTLSLPRLIVGIAAFVLLGFPLVGYLWDTLNQLMAGDVRPMRLAISLPLLLVLAGVLAWLARVVRRWEAERLENVHTPPAS